MEEEDDFYDSADAVPTDQSAKAGGQDASKQISTDIGNGEEEVEVEEEEEEEVCYCPVSRGSIGHVINRVIG